MGHDVGEVDIDNVSLVAGHIGTENLTGSPVTDPTDQATDTDTVDSNGAAIHLTAAHSIMSAAEAQNAFEVSAEPSASWTVTLTGSNYAAAQAAKGEAETSLAGLNAQLTPLVAIAGLEQLGLDELNAALDSAAAAESSKQSDKSVAEAEYNTAYSEARAAFVAATADPDSLTEGDAVVAPITSPSVTIDADAVAGGATWSQSQIDGLTVDMDNFIAAHTWPDAQGQTVDQLEGELNDAIAQLGSAQQQVLDATGDRDAQQEVADIAAGAVIAKQGEIAATEAELQEAQALVDDATVVKTGTGTGSAQVVSLDADDLIALGDGQVAIELITGGSSVSAGFDLDTTADGEDEIVLAVSVAGVINDTESGNVTLALSGVDDDAEVVTVTLTDVGGAQLTAAAEAGNNGDWTVDVSGGVLADGSVAVSVSVTDDAGNTASASTAFDLDTTADELGDLAVTVGDISSESGSEQVTLTMSGVDTDVDPATGVVITLTDSDGNDTTASYDSGDGTWIGDLTGLSGRQITVSTTVEDAAGNQSTVTTVAAINRAPEFTATMVEVSCDEGLSPGDVVYQASATDVNGDGLVYSLSGPDAQLMEIDDLSGRIRFKQSPDYESGKTVYEVTVVASDGDLTASQDVTVNVNNVNESPDFDHDSVFLQQNENIDTTQVIWNASATDADGDDVTYSLGGNDAGAFDIDENTGVVTFAESPDYESGVTSYDFTITASDGSLTDEQAVTVQINNVVEQYTLDAADLASGGEFVGEAMDDRMDGRGATSALELSGGAGTDVLYGGDAGDVLDGGDGNDQLSGGGGDDVLIAGTGVDRIDGGDGIDTVVLGSSDEMVSINLSREWQYSGDGWNQIVNVENVVTGGGADIIKGNDIGNVVESGAGNDWVYANGGDDVLIGGEGIDRLFGGDGNDTVLYETDENLVIDLNSEWQLSNGETSEGIDKLIDIENVTTGSGEDVLIGNDGANVLTGGDGDDTLTGGDGADVFRFYSSEGASTDVITDFTVGEDSIELIDDTTGEVAQAQITTDASGSTVTWDELTIVLDVNVNYDDINPITD